MDWFHCNQCYATTGSKFAVSSCGHIVCAACITAKQCSICGASCSYLPITDQMKPQEKVFFKDPLKLTQSCLEHVSQIAFFQRTQMEKVIVHFKRKAYDLERRLQQVIERGYRELSELKKENADLKKQLYQLKKETSELQKPLSQRRVSPRQFQSNGRMSLPVGITSPVTSAHLRTMSHPGSSESQGWAPNRGVSLPSLNTPAVSGTPLSSHGSLHELRLSKYLRRALTRRGSSAEDPNGFGGWEAREREKKVTPTPFSTPTRYEKPFVHICKFFRWEGDYHADGESALSCRPQDSAPPS